VPLEVAILGGCKFEACGVGFESFLLPLSGGSDFGVPQGSEGTLMTQHLDGTLKQLLVDIR